MGRRVLIAGCGDLGTRVGKLLLFLPETQVWGVRRQRPTEDDHTGIQWLCADLSRPESLTKLPPGITDIIFTAAPNERSEHAYRATYLEGLQNVIAAAHCAALNRVIFISSTAVYGDHGQDWVDETTPTQPSAFNGCILCETEQWLLNYSAETRCTTVSLRLSGIYGPGRNYLLERLRQGSTSAPLGQDHWVNRIHIDDAARAVVHIMYLTHPLATYLVTDSTPLPMRTLYEHLAKLVGGPVPAVGPPLRTVGSKRLSNARLRDSGFTFNWPDSREA